MGRKRHGAEQIIAKLREAEVELARGKTAGEVCRKLGVTEQTYDIYGLPPAHKQGPFDEGGSVADIYSASSNIACPNGESALRWTAVVAPSC